MLKIIFSAFVVLKSVAIFSFPENIRMGYLGCNSCHVNPTGGGLLTNYGRESTKDFLNTWSPEQKADMVSGGVEQKFLFAGDFRGLLLSKATGATFIPMQMELGLGYQFTPSVTAVVSGGLYKQTIDSQNHYLLYQVNDHIFLKGGRFFPAYGLLFADHTLVTRRGLGFDRGQQSYNIEAGYLAEAGDVIVNYITDISLGEYVTDQHGVSVRASKYLGSSYQIGINRLMKAGKTVSSTLSGVFASLGLTKDIYWLLEGDIEAKTTTIKTTALKTTQIKQNKFVQTHELGWQFYKGVHLIGTFQSSTNFDSKYNSSDFVAPTYGLQWFPYTHLELLLEYRTKYQKVATIPSQNAISLMLHAYL